MMLRTMQLVTFSLCVASAVALPTPPPTSVPKTVTAPRIPSASFFTALATQPTLGNETMSDQQMMVNFTTSATTASIYLSQVTTDAHNIYKSMLDLTGVTIQTLQMGMKAGASDATKVSAVKGAMTLFAASAQSSAQQLEALKEKVRTIAKAQELYATMLTIATELNNAAIFVKTMPDPDFWSMTLRELEKLKTDLQKAYDAGQPSAAAPPSPSPAPQ